MSKKMTPCEKLGYKVGDKFEHNSNHVGFKRGAILTLKDDNGSYNPAFYGEGGLQCGKWAFLSLKYVKPLTTPRLRPAKQALADAIHQNGGWPNCCHCNFATSSNRILASFFTQRPVIQRGYQLTGWVRAQPLGLTRRPLPNWHQTILSRDEYFAAYPEQVEVDVSSETEHKAEAKMKSASEITIKASDWHKNGELPPVGEVVDVWFDDGRQCWDKAEVIGYNKHEGGVIAASLIGMNDRKLVWVHHFRPIRTERDRAIDDMAKVIIVKSPVRISTEDATYLAGEIHDLGYRKGVN
jgi:hypothetical protein